MRNSKKNVDHGVVLASGRGSRLKHISGKLPKPLFPVKGKPIIDYALLALESASVSRVTIVVSSRNNPVENYVIGRYRNRLELEFVVQKRASGPGNALLKARNSTSVHESDILVVACDYQMPSDYLLDLIRFHQSHTANISLSCREILGTDAHRSSLVVLDSFGGVVNIDEKPSQQIDSKTIIASSLIYILPKAIHEYVRTTEPSKREEIEIPAAINRMVIDGYKAKALVQNALPDWQKL